MEELEKRDQDDIEEASTLTGTLSLDVIDGKREIESITEQAVSSKWKIGHNPTTHPFRDKEKPPPNQPERERER